VTEGDSENGTLIISNAFTTGSKKKEATPETEQDKIRQSAMSILTSPNALDENSMTVLNDILEIGFKVDAWDDGQYRQLRDTLDARANKESLSANDHVAFELEGLVRAIDYIRSERRRGLRAA
jgi:hypothetical protein